MSKRRPIRRTKLEGFAVELGTVLGAAAAKADKWLSQRNLIVQQLADVRDTAIKLLADMGHAADHLAVHGRPAGSKNKKGIIIVGGRPAIRPVPTIMRSTAKGIVRRTRRLSAKGRAAISRAQKARWAKIKADNKGKRR
jgi:hypothetical protein